MKTSRTQVSVLLLAVMVAALLAACGGTAPTEEDAASDVPPVVIDNFAVIAEGALLPLDSVQLSFNGGGRIVEVMIEEGDVVEVGDVLARLEDSEQIAAEVVRAQQALLDAEQSLVDLQDPDPYALAAAQAESDIANAEDQLDAAVESLRNLYNPDLDYYQDEVDRARDNLANAQDNTELTEINTAQFQLDAARENLEDFEEYLATVQAEIDNCPDDPDRDFCDPNRRVTVAPGFALTLEDAQENYNDALNNFRQAEIRLQQARRGNENAVDDAQEVLDDALEDLQFAKADPDPIDVQLREADITFWQAQLKDAKDRLADAQRGPDPDDIALLEANIETANANLQAAQATLDDLELVAPIGGTVARTSLKVGESVSPGAPVITVADLSGWIVETDNLTEIEVVEVAVGQQVTVVLDALPEVELAGEVTDISTVFEEKRGDVTYTVEIRLNDEDPRMRWGMTAVVTFEEP